MRNTNNHLPDTTLWEQIVIMMERNRRRKEFEDNYMAIKIKAVLANNVAKNAANK